MTLRTGLLVSVPDFMGHEHRWRTKWEWSGAPTTRSWEVYTRKSSILGPLGNNFGMCTFLFCYFIIIILCTLGWFGLRPWRGRSYLTTHTRFWCTKGFDRLTKEKWIFATKKKKICILSCWLCPPFSFSVFEWRYSSFKKIYI